LVKTQLGIVVNLKFHGLKLMAIQIESLKHQEFFLVKTQLGIVANL
jgi:hypothetical protein